MWAIAGLIVISACAAIGYRGFGFAFLVAFLLMYGIPAWIFVSMRYTRVKSDIHGLLRLGFLGWR